MTHEERLAEIGEDIQRGYEPGDKDSNMRDSMRPWFAIDGSFRRDGKKRWDYGVWSQAGIAGGGHATVQVWRHHDRSCLVGVSAGANLSPSQSRTLAKALWAAAEKAEAEDASPAPDILGELNMKGPSGH
jgi:hypothetical protein